MGSQAYLTAGDVKELLDVDASTIYRMASDGRLPAFRVGRRWRFPVTAIERIIGGPADDLEVGFHAVAAQSVIDAMAPSLGVMMVVIDLSGTPVTGVANPCPWFSERSTDPGTLTACIDHWGELAGEVDLSSSFRQSVLGFECAGAFVRSGTRLIGMVLAGGIAPEGSTAPGLHQLDADQRHSLLESLPRVAALLSRVALRDSRSER